MDTYMGNLRLYQHYCDTARVHCRILIQDFCLPTVSFLELPVLLGKLPSFPIPSLGFHCHTKLLLRSCHGLGNGVLDVDVHWDTLDDGHVCHVQSLGDVSGSVWHCRELKDVGIHPHTFGLYSLGSSHPVIFGICPFPWQQCPPVRIPQDLGTRSLRGEYCYIP